MNVELERPVEITCSGQRMLGILHAAPNAGHHTGLLIVVGGPQYRVGSHRQFVRLARDLAALGVPVLRFDCRGMGDSQGEFAGFEHIAPDIEAAIDVFASIVPDLTRVVLFGLCDAASAALMYRDTVGRVAGLVLANPWVRTTQGQARAFVRHYYARRVLDGSFWRKLMRGDLRLRESVIDLLHRVRRSLGGGSVHNSAPTFVERMLSGLTSFGGPVLIVTSEHDLTAREFEDLCKAAPQWRAAVRRPNVRRVKCANADHTFSTARAHELLLEQIIRWLQSETFLNADQRNVCARQQRVVER